MSGPKISVYSLTGRAREIVFGQMRCEQQSLVCAARIQEIIRSYSGISERMIRNIQLLMKRTSKGSGQVEKLKQLQAEAETELAVIRRELQARPARQSPKYWITEEAYREKQEELKHFQALRQRAETLKAKLDEAFEQDRMNIAGIQASILRELSDPAAGKADEGRRQSKNAEDIRKRQAAILEDLNGVYSFELESERPDTGFREKKEAVRKELSQLQEDDSLPESLDVEIQQALDVLQKIELLPYLKTFHSITVRGLLRKAEACRQVEEQKRRGYSELVARYEALCTMAGETARSLPYSETAEKTIREETERLESQIVRQQEQEYISDCIDEVMSEMGYDLIGAREVCKKSGKRFRNELYTFNEGTAVNVTFSQDGQIAMELGGLAREDRTPTSEETEQLTRDMEQFCGAFEEFERRMRSRGITVGDRIALSPPDPQFASIINVNDYDIEKADRVSVMHGKKRRKQEAKQALSRSDSV